MKAEAGEGAIEAIDWRMLEELPPQVEIGGEFTAVRNAGADLLPEAATPEDGFLLDEVGAFWPPMHSGVVAATGESGHLLHTLEAAILLHAEFPKRGDPLHFWKLIKNLPHGGECPREVEVGGIQPAHDFAGGFGKAFVDGMVLAGVFFTAPEGELRGVALDDFATAVCGTAINHDILHIRPASIRRQKHAADRLVQVCGLVIGGSDDGNFQKNFRK